MLKKRKSASVPARQDSESGYSHWVNVSQKAELEFHKRSTISEDTDGFRARTVAMWERYGFKRDRFKDKTIIDIGAGSKSRVFYFEQPLKTVAIEPCADDFIKEIPWCDLKETFTEIYSVPAEERISTLGGQDLFIL